MIAYCVKIRAIRRHQLSMRGVAQETASRRLDRYTCEDQMIYSWPAAAREAQQGPASALFNDPQADWFC